nr:hypothetical protein BaRGS_029460 [Batillaria attramentaria]
MCIVGACCYQKRTRMRKKQEDQKNLERDDPRLGDWHQYFNSAFKPDQPACSLPRVQRNFSDGYEYCGSFRKNN